MTAHRFFSSPSRRSRALRPTLAALALAGLGALPALAQEPPGVGRVISVSPMHEGGQPAGYSVTYDYNGRQYTTRTDTPPGPTIPVQAGPYGVTTYPVAPQPALNEGVMAEGAPSTPAQVHPEGVQPEPGVVVSRGAPYGAPAPVYGGAYGPPPVYAAPGYAYPPAYLYAPIGLSIGLGYSRGWHHGRYRHWR